MTFSIADWVAGTTILVAALVIPFVIRRWITKRPFRKISGAIIASAMWLALFSFFYWAASLVGQQDAYMRKGHIGILLVAFATYCILVNPRQRTAVNDPKTRKPDDSNAERSVDKYHDHSLLRDKVSIGIFPRYVVPLIIGIIVGLLGSVMMDSITSTESYDDCILDLMPEAQTREAALLIRQACERKHKAKSSMNLLEPTFPEKNHKTE